MIGFHQNITTYEDLDRLAQYLSHAPCVGFDLETHGLHPFDETKIAGLGFGVFSKIATATNVSVPAIYTFYLPVGHIGQDNLDEATVLDSLAAVFSSVPKFGANIKFDAHFIWVRGYEVRELDDIQTMARLLRSDFLNVSLSTLIKREFGREHAQEKALKEWWRKNKIKYSGKGGDPKRYAKAPASLVGQYCGADIYWTLLIAKRYAKLFSLSPGLKNIYERVERPLIEAVSTMEREGAYIDLKYLKGVGTALDRKVLSLERDVFTSTRKTWDIMSAPQTKKILLGEGVRPENRRRKRPDGSVEFTPSLDKTVLKKYEGSNPLVAAILQYRRCRSYKASFVDNIMFSVEEGADKLGHIHTQLRPDSARSGRFGCSSPNLLALPKDDEDDPMAEFSIRKAFVPANIYSMILTIDFVSMEYMMAASLSKDAAMIKMLKADTDIHSQVARTVYGVAEPTKKQRSIAKTFNFSDMYGAGVTSMAAKLSLPAKEIAKFKRSHKNQFPQFHRWKRRVMTQCERNGGVRNIFGRFRIVPKAKSYIAVNTLIQGTCADVMKLILLRLDKYFKLKKSHVMFPVHDEVVINYDVRDGDIIGSVISIMERVSVAGKDVFDPPLRVDVSVCRRNWAEKEPFDMKDLMALVVKRRLEVESVEVESLPEMQRIRASSEGQNGNQVPMHDEENSIPWSKRGRDTD